MKILKEIEYLEGVKVLLRVDLNVPVEGGSVKDDYRIRVALPTIDYLTSRKAKVILISHFEPKGDESNSLDSVAKHFEKLDHKVTFLKNVRQANEYISNVMKNGEVILLENLRVWDGEKGNDKKFAQELASLGDIFVNDAFSVCHRKHASIVGVPQYLPSYAGLQLEKEMQHLSQAFTPTHPFLFILGGAKFDTKLPLLEKFMQIADNVFVGGALANDFLRVNGYEVGQSLVMEEGNPSVEAINRFLGNSKLLLPIDVIDENKKTYPANKFTDKGKIMDVGTETIDLLIRKINDAKFILWNGPLGLYEGGYQEGTLAIAKAIADVTSKNVISIVGGGDTIAAIQNLDIEDKFTFISGGGGAMLDYLAQGTLPGIEALNTTKEK